MNYWLHRISHESAVSHKLLSEENYLTIGWQCYLETDLLSNFRTNEGSFSEFMNKVGDRNRARWSLEKFFRFKQGDIVIIPLWQEVAIYEVVETAIPISSIQLKNPLFTNWNNEKTEVCDDGLYTQKPHGSEIIDLGYAVKVKKITKKPRSYAEPSLVARMKVRSTTSQINDLSAAIEKLISATAPTSLSEKLKEECSKNVLDAVKNSLTPERFEKLIKWYMSKMGANKVEIPSKNEKGKKNGADADVVAHFDDLKLIFYVQGKKHNGETDDWAVHQIKEYKLQKENTKNDTTYISWVITLADSYSEQANTMAEENNVRLINGLEFAQMLMNAGFKDMDGHI